MPPKVAKYTEPRRKVNSVVSKVKKEPKRKVINRTFAPRNIEKHLRANDFHLAACADLLQVSLQEMTDYVLSVPKLKQLYEIERELKNDIAERALFEKVKKGDPKSVQYWLETHARHRGYGAQSKEVNTTITVRTQEVADIIKAKHGALKDGTFTDADFTEGAVKLIEASRSARSDPDAVSASPAETVTETVVVKQKPSKVSLHDSRFKSGADNPATKARLEREAKEGKAKEVESKESETSGDYDL